MVGPASLSVVRYTRLRPFVLRVNDQGGDPIDLVETKEEDKAAPPAGQHRGTCMTRRISNFDAPDRFVAGTIGEPGHRAFFLQARQGGSIVSVAAEKTQVAVLAANLAALLDTLAERGVEGIPTDAGRSPDRRRAAGRAAGRGVPGRGDDDRLGQRRARSS